MCISQFHNHIIISQQICFLTVVKERSVRVQRSKQNLKMRVTDLPTNLLTRIGARDAAVLVKRADQFGEVGCSQLDQVPPPPAEQTLPLQKHPPSPYTLLWGRCWKRNIGKLWTFDRVFSPIIRLSRLYI